jgi:hypothetical protein
MEEEAQVVEGSTDNSQINNRDNTEVGVQTQELIDLLLIIP